MAGGRDKGRVEPEWEEDDRGWRDPPTQDTLEPAWPGGDMNPPWVVLKFGGTSVTTVQNWERIESVLRERLDEGVQPVVVCSALSRVSDALERLLDAAAGGKDILPALRFLVDRHAEQAEAMGLDLAKEAGDLLQDLERLAHGASLIGEASHRLRARIMSAGELISTRLGAAWLNARGMEVSWQDAREILRSRGGEDLLQATCAYEADAALQERFASLEQPVVITQGFIARDPKGDTVLLGRGGSDTSATTLAAMLQAQRVEIWTDVPGMFTANPRQVPAARLLRRLDYDEAQELATTGATVLHPRCIPPVREHGIPLQVRCTTHPQLPGTLVTAVADGSPRVKAVSHRKGIALVSMNTVGMWHQVGFLADAFALFKKHGLSVDLVATSESSVTVSLDGAQVPEALLTDLATICRPRVIAPVAAVSLVGRRIRAILHRLGPVVERFEEHRVHLLSQAASDLNLTVVVDEDQAEPLVAALHALLFSEVEGDDFGESWETLFAAEGSVGEEAPSAPPWWEEKLDALRQIAAEGSPAYVYDLATAEGAARDLLSLRNIDRLLYAVKANPNPELLRLFHGLGLGFECVSPGELEHLVALFGELPPTLFTPNFAPREDYERGFELGAQVTLDSLFPLEHWPDLFRQREVFVRIDPGRGRGHHRFVVTAGSQSKFGIPLEEVERLQQLAERHELRVVGLHAHAGSGILEATAWREKADLLAQIATLFPDVQTLDLGGGLGVPDRAGRPALDVEALDASLDHFREDNQDFALWLEPGRFLVAQAGVLLTRVTQVKRKGERTYIGVDAGMNSLIRPALYGAWHDIVNLDRLDQPGAITADIVGPICETGDVLGHGRHLPETSPGDLLAILTTGAYGRAMSSTYNLREPAREALL